MKRIIVVVCVLSAALFARSLVQAQGTLYVSNLGQTPTGSAAIGSDGWIAQTIYTGNNPNGYMLNSIELLMDDAVGTASGFTVSVYSKGGDPHIFNSSDSPQISLGSLSGLDPSSAGLFTYAASDLTLSPSTYYFVLVTATTPIAQGAYVWSAANSLTSGSESWVIERSYFSSSDGSSWVWHGRGDVYQMAIYATPAPEPSTLALAGLGLAAMGFWRFRQSK